jgi:predicted glycosyltransferase
MAEYARKHTWNEKRDGYRASVSDTALSNTRERHVSEHEEMLEEAIKLIRASFYEYGRQLKAGLVEISPKDLATLVSAMQLISGGATNRSEATVLGVHITDPGTAGHLDIDLLRELERLTRSKLVGAGDGRTAAVRIEGSGNN